MTMKAIIGTAITPLVGYIIDAIIQQIFDFSFLESIFNSVCNIMNAKIPIWTVVLFATAAIIVYFITHYFRTRSEVSYAKEYTADKYLLWHWTWEYKHPAGNLRKFTVTNLKPVCKCGGHLAEANGYLTCPLCQNKYQIPSKEDYGKTRAYIISTVDTRYTKKSLRQNINNNITRIKSVTSFKLAREVFSELSSLYPALNTRDKVRILISTIDCNIRENDPEYSNQILASLDSNSAAKLVLKRAYIDARKRLPLKYRQAYKHRHPSIDHNHNLAGLTVEQAILK